MKGLELNEKFYFEVVKPLIEDEFPMIKEKYAAGLIGYGSDVLGNDDELSRDHEWGPRCHIWLSNDDYDKYAVDIDKMLLDKLPISYKGYYTRYVYDKDYRALVTVPTKKNSFHHIGITTVERHMKIQFGIKKKHGEYSLSDLEWLCIPEQKLLELTRGNIFEDKIGEITNVREKFKYYDDEIWKYKLLYCWDEISYLELIPLCFARGDEIGGKICLNRVIENIIRITYLYNKTYYPGYLKWYGYEFSKLPKIAKDIEENIKLCQESSDINIIMNNIRSIIEVLLKTHNEIGITETLNIENSKTNRGLCNISVGNVTNSIEKSLSEKFKALGVRGACDQWITNSDLLVWSENFTELKRIYENKTLDRSGIGDMIV
ncbi:DUF4037 domain-containing protein [Clostridium sp. LIBA-8841]|uniref:DUF4037 domain-containing protein n=1 Tax=Clostridium sp. LIBA-8841 TaxID=2987530 RepID=UPI002AC56662|nr:DUF4037 domain-containing protein [Clostridium sp. LIBA-8841]MDZ5254104.1 DUF4037 domain-containing protein [Clostridium sp. LIBA-8841]